MEFFYKFSDEIKEAIIPLMREKFFHPGEHILSFNQVNEHLYFIQKGEVTLRG